MTGVEVHVLDSEFGQLAASLGELDVIVIHFADEFRRPEVLEFLKLVGGLVFVGLQLRQSQEIAIASQYQERASTAVEYYSSQMQNERALNCTG